MSFPQSGITESALNARHKFEDLQRDITPLVALIENQLEHNCGCDWCNQARKAIQEFHEKYPKTEDVK